MRPQPRCGLIGTKHEGSQSYTLPGRLREIETAAFNRGPQLTEVNKYSSIIERPTAQKRVEPLCIIGIRRCAREQEAQGNPNVVTEV
jgi:hypothetical protein